MAREIHVFRDLRLALEKIASRRLLPLALPPPMIIDGEDDEYSDEDGEADVPSIGAAPIKTALPPRSAAEHRPLTCIVGSHKCLPRQKLHKDGAC